MDGHLVFLSDPHLTPALTVLAWTQEFCVLIYALPLSFISVPRESVEAHEFDSSGFGVFHAPCQLTVGLLSL